MALLYNRPVYASPPLAARIEKPDFHNRRSATCGILVLKSGGTKMGLLDKFVGIVGEALGGATGGLAGGQSGG
ncbi:MAG: hypothetical protein LBL00_03425 [Endomicrobium sp.]|jgi:hypothetical protein|nr:hypothetical protein [Endomicrobium sp.]